MTRLRLKSAAALKRMGLQAKAASRKRSKKSRPPLIHNKPAELRTASDGSIELIMPVRLVNNNDGQKRHWYLSAEARAELGMQFKAWFPGRRPLGYPVKVIVTRILGKGQRLWDEDSIGRGNAKQIIDSLVGCRFFHDDKPKWIAKVDYAQDDTQRLEYPRVSVRIEKA